MQPIIPQANETLQVNITNSPPQQTRSFLGKTWDFITSETAQGFYCSTLVTLACVFLFDFTDPLSGILFTVSYYIVNELLVWVIPIKPEYEILKKILIYATIYTVITCIFIFAVGSLTFPASLALVVCASSGYAWRFFVKKDEPSENEVLSTIAT